MFLKILSSNASWSGGRLSISFSVIPEDDTAHLNLITGGIFQDDIRAKFYIQDDKKIPATLFVGRQEHNSMGAMLPSEMSYIRANLNDCSEIWLIWRLADDELRDFHSLILAGLKPRTATVSFISNDYLKYGWEPDGSGMTWNNEKFPSVQIERVEFQFDLKEPALGLSPPISPSGEIIRGMAAIELGIRNLSWGVWLIAALLLGLAVKLGWF